MVTNPGTSTFNALLNNSVVDTFSTATNNTSSNNFYGFTGVTFDAIRVTAANNFATIDNIQFGTATAQSVPEPFSIIGTLVGGTAAFRIRKKLADANKV
ncbi:PEP-CTERM sorting domain-containing protein [Chamaesiphon sp. OTE_8_metabat_110]|uniref:PEP-CTERM sorting domain-containing protein n=1 Tax=Chamaesiphon sp. OTE_8_metabat_110 TaxID=2964696 RepID=UPI00286BFFFF|nr:PEP-CTERM sorting domain-containing protein [Chamaesiphon sp. OTE_8_metabat_110]